MAISPSTTWTRPDLGMSVDEFDARADREGFIGSKVAPIIPRARDQGDFAKRELEAVLREERTDRQANGTYPRSNATWTKDNYQTAERAHEGTLDDRTVRRFDDVLPDAEAWETERVTDIVLRSYERAVAAAIFNATTFSAATTAVTNEWDDATNAVPLTDVDTARELIVAAFGQEPNALIMNRKVFRNVRNTDQIIDRIKYQGFVDVRPGQITPQILASAFDIDMIIVAGALTNTANEMASRSISRIWGDEYAMLAKIGTTRNPAESCLAQTLMWAEEGAMDGDRMAVLVEQYRENQRRGNVIRVRTDDVIKVKFTAAGHLLSNITT